MGLMAATCIPRVCKMERSLDSNDLGMIYIHDSEDIINREISSQREYLPFPSMLFITNSPAASIPSLAVKANPVEIEGGWHIAMRHSYPSKVSTQHRWSLLYPIIFRSCKSPNWIAQYSSLYHFSALELLLNCRRWRSSSAMSLASAS